MQTICNPESPGDCNSHLYTFCFSLSSRPFCSCMVNIKHLGVPFTFKECYFICDMRDRSERKDTEEEKKINKKKFSIISHFTVIQSPRSNSDILGNYTFDYKSKS